MLTHYEYRYRIVGEDFNLPIQCTTENSIDNGDGTITITAIPNADIVSSDFQVRKRASGANPPSPWLNSSTGFTFKVPVNYDIIYSKDNFINAEEFISHNITTYVSEGKLILEPYVDGDFDTYIEIPVSSSILESFSLSFDFKMLSVPDVRTFGIGIGRRSFNTFGKGSILARYGLYSDETADKLILNNQNGGDEWLQYSIADNHLGGEGTDNFRITIVKIKNNLTATIYNLTKDTNQSLVINYPMGDTPNIYLPNTGKYVINTFGGYFEISNIELYTVEPKYCDIMVCGDSKTQGYSTSAIDLGFVNLLREEGIHCVNAGGGWDRSIEALDRIEEMKSLRPNIFINNIGSNDKRTGISFEDWSTRFQQISNEMKKIGCEVYAMKMFNEDVLSFADYNAFIDENYPPERIISVSTLSLAPDRVHPNDADQIIIKTAIINAIS